MAGKSCGTIADSIIIKKKFLLDFYEITYQKMGNTRYNLKL